MASSLGMRRLLRALRKPHLLHDDPLANELASALGAASPREAVLTVLERALHDYDPHCRQLVELCDVRGQPGKAAAEELHLSERSFYRMRSLVIAALELTIADVRRAPPRHMVLELRPNCECCNKDLPSDAPDAMICSYECTFCRRCVETVLGGRCPNCGGTFAPRPIRPPTGLATHPPSTTRVIRAGCGSVGSSSEQLSGTY